MSTKNKLKSVIVVCLVGVFLWGAWFVSSRPPESISNIYAIYFRKEVTEYLRKIKFKSEDEQRAYIYGLLYMSDDAMNVGEVKKGGEVILETKTYHLWDFPLQDDCKDEAKTMCWVKYEEPSTKPAQ